MSSPAQIVIEDVGVHLYTHRRSSEIEQLAAQALDRSRDRWEQPDYVARVVLDDLTGCSGGIRGFGIAATNYPRAYKTLSVDLHNQTVALESIYDEKDWGMSLTDFVEEYG